MEWLPSKVIIYEQAWKPQEQANAGSGGRAAPVKIVQVVLFLISMKNEFICSHSTIPFMCH